MTARKTASYTFKTLKDLTIVLMNIFNDFPHLEVGRITVHELMINAIEHGNLGINFEEKQKLLTNNTLHEEIENRLKDKRYKNRTSSIIINKYKTETIIEICDEGHGFAWQKFFTNDPLQIKGLHGRGILMSRKYCSTLKYNDSGNRVTAVFDHKKDHNG